MQCHRSRERQQRHDSAIARLIETALCQLYPKAAISVFSAWPVPTLTILEENSTPMVCGKVCALKHGSISPSRSDVDNR
jgi:hypothetical protein